MSYSYPLKNLPAPVQLLIKPMLLISLGLHGLLLLVPISSDEENPILAKKEEAVKITQLPDASSKPSGKSASKAPSKASQSRRASSSSRPRSVALPGSQGAETRQLGSAGEQTRGTSGATEASGAGEESNDPWADFPHYSGAQPGCFGKQSCRQTTAELDQVAAHFVKQLPARKYTALPVADGANRKVYQVSKAGKTLYLNLFADAKGAVYVLAPDQLASLDELKKALEVPAELYTAIGQLNGAGADDTSFVQPGYFYTKSSSEDEKGSVLPPEPFPAIDGTPQLVSGKTPEQVYSNLQPQLQSSNIKVAKAKPYGLGDLYKLQKGTFTGYLSLVPSKDRKGTIVVVWTQSPN
jgi:hypothetical protein